MKLFTKGLLLIAVPSVVELALLGVVFDTQEQTAQAAQWVSNSKQILYQSSAMVDPLLRQAGVTFASATPRDAQTAVEQLERLARSRYWNETRAVLANLYQRAFGGNR